MTNLKRVAVLGLFFLVVSLCLSTAYATDNKQVTTGKTQAKVAPKANVAAPAKAATARGVAGRQEERHDFRGHDFKHFSPHEREVWNGGAWHHARFHGQEGYWWAVGDMWYFYDRPIYPYPVVVPAVAFEAAVVPVRPIGQQPVLVIQPQTQQFLYWCDNPRGYSPYVNMCPTGWRQIPAQTTAAPPPPPPPPPVQSQMMPPPPPQ